ncbi:MAG: hypothetical protein IPM55_03085 [Acidobacteria bacterium]|nr:hypothetical protein [Acidobacteriota bacterium]
MKGQSDTLLLVVEEHDLMDVTSKIKTKTYRVEREFGLIVGIVLSLIGGWKVYHGNTGPVAISLLSLGLGLIVAGLLLPQLLVIPNRAWMRLAMLLSMITTPIMLGLIYFLLIMPIGVAKRMMGWDPLRRRAASAQSYWSPYNKRQNDPRHFERMF